MTQYSLFGRARRTDPATSHEAGQSINLPHLETVVLSALDNDGLTSEEVSMRTGIPLVTVSPRFRPLLNKGLIVDTGMKRRNQSGRNAIVWKKKNQTS